MRLLFFDSAGFNHRRRGNAGDTGPVVIKYKRSKLGLSEKHLLFFLLYMPSESLGLNFTDETIFNSPIPFQEPKPGF